MIKFRYTSNYNSKKNNYNSAFKDTFNKSIDNFSFKLFENNFSSL